ncbi:MAG: hypothetical protein HZB55_21860 [Deltaproteobacteria bacterium]|nr:hypothetical protein [Deltaproteobacteria bacterium]
MKERAVGGRCAVLALLLGTTAFAWAGGGELTVRLGKPFPNLEFDELVAPGDYAALGLPPGSFRLADIQGQVLVLEFFNRYCLTSWRQSLQLESLGKLLGPGGLEGKVRILSVGAGNTAAELRQFRTEQRITYPLATDPRFDRYNDLGEPGGTPFTAFLVRRGEVWTLADSHVGFYGDAELLVRARVLLGQGTAETPEAPDAEGDRDTAPAAVDAEVRAFLSRVAGTTVGIEPMELSGGTRVFRALGPTGSPTGLYARLATRAPVCDLGHRIRFLFAFDDGGIARGFEPIYLMKFGNELWSAADSARFRARLVGRRMDELAFDADVDAVTSATMSSALVYDELRRTAARLRESQKNASGPTPAR